MNHLMQAELHQNRHLDLLREAQRDHLARQAQPKRENRPGLNMNLRALLVRLNLA